MSAACDACLRRAYLVGALAGRIARLLHPARRPVRGLLALDDETLLEAVAPRAGDRLREELHRFDAAAALEDLRRRSLQSACRHGPVYPRQLGQLSDPPPVLFIAGDAGAVAALGEEPAAAIVGTRRPSHYGLEIAYSLGRGLGAARVPVVSGLALGVDGTAHRGCLDGGGVPVAVLAGGVDVPYPSTHRMLYERVRERGAVVSELPPGRRPYRWAFPARNRIMAGLAAMTVVVEAADPSGSLITSDFAADLDRSVGAVPGRATSTVAQGVNRLLAEGARMVTKPEDVLDELFGVDVRPPRDDGGGAGLDRVRLKVLEAVEAGLGIDGICASAGLAAGEARAALARLEASGHVRRDGFGLYRRTVTAA